jgi:hypothetical protein
MWGGCVFQYPDDSSKSILFVFDYRIDSLGDLGMKKHLTCLEEMQSNAGSGVLYKNKKVY